MRKSALFQIAGKLRGTPTDNGFKQVDIAYLAKVTDSLLGTNCYSQEADCALVLSIMRGFLFTCEF